MLKNILFSIITLFILAGCATKPIDISKAKPIPQNRIYNFTQNQNNNTATVTFVRDVGFLGSAIYQHLYIDGKKAAELMPGEKVTFQLKANEHVFDVIPTDPFGQVSKSSIVADLKSGHKYYYRILMDGRTFKSYINRIIYNK